MSFFDFDFIENFFFVSLGITFVLIILLVYHFKQRIASMERKGDTMYELITNVVKELQFMKKLNAYYETLFQNTTTPVDDNSPKENSLSPTPSGLTRTPELRDGHPSVTDSCLVKEVSADNIVLNLVERTSSVEDLSSKDNQELHENSRIVVSEDESSVSDNESDSDDTDLNYSTDDEDSDDDDTENNGEDLSSEVNAVLKSVENNEPVHETGRTTERRRSEGVRGITGDGLPSKVIPNVVSPGISQTPVEMNHLMEMIQKAFANGISPQEPQKFAPYYEQEFEQSNSYKPLVIHDEEQITDEPIVDILSEDGLLSKDNVLLTPGIPQFMNNDSARTPERRRSVGVRGLSGDGLPSKDNDMQELDITEFGEFSQHPEETLDNSVIEKEPIVAEKTFSVEDKSSPVEQFTYETPNVVSPGIPQFTYETSNVVSPGIPQFTYETPNVVSPGIPQVQSPVLPIDKKQNREVYRKMNITQLRGIATAAGITADTTKMKKNELIQLLENLEE